MLKLIKKLVRPYLRRPLPPPPNSLGEPGTKAFTFTIEKSDLQITSSTYTIRARSAEEARIKFWLYWCGADMDGAVYKAPVHAVHTETHRRKIRSVDNDMMADSHAQILADIITGALADPLKYHHVLEIVKPLLEKARNQNYFSNKKNT